ncbi:MAG TPA: PorV/PorQ family protein [Rhodothermales bacterium]|nr:PorV/PorQ family protein [Rhodothermales bacterium]
MRKSIPFYLLSLALALALVPQAFAQSSIPDVTTPVETAKRGQTGMKFLTVSIDPRATAMGGAVTAETQGNSTALFYNPASMARMEGTFSASAGIAQYITNVQYNAASIAYRPAHGNYGVFGISLESVDYGDDFYETILTNKSDLYPEGFIQLGTFSPTALQAGFGYARSFTDRFSVGAQVKYVLQDLGSFARERVSDGGQSLPDGTQAAYEKYSVSAPAVDFGILYNTGFRSLTIAMSTRNFGPERKYALESFEMPLTFQIGVSMNLLDFTSLNPNVHALQFAVDAERPRDFAEHLRLGGEYTYRNVLSLRAGWANAFVQDGETEEGVSLGAGLQYRASTLGFGIDYAYTNFGIFGNVNRFAAHVSF